MPPSDSSQDALLEGLAEEFVQRHRRGERPTPAEYADRYPDLAADIRDLFPALVQIERLKPEADEATGDFVPSRGSPNGPIPDRLGEYRILRELGHGGMGVVYEAEQESLGRHVALKMLLPTARLHRTYLERFQREARAAARLHHTNIVPVFGVGEVDGTPFYAMQFIVGQGLDRILDDVRRLRAAPGAATGTVPPAESSLAHSLLTGRFATGELAAPPAPSVATVTEGAPSSGALSAAGPEGHYHRGITRVGLQVADALAYAHRQGILHRDIKPSNLLLDQQGTVWITDFGLAKAEGADDLTQTGDIVGTMRFMAPERFEGRSLPQSDVYALGATLYELLTLRPAFEDLNRARLMEKVVREPPVPPRKLDPRLPRDLETVVLKCLAKEPAQRYASAEALAEDLRRFLSDRPVLARRSSWRERTWRWCRRNPAITGLLATVAGVLLAGSTVALFLAHRANQNAQQAQANETKALNAKAAADGARRELQQNLYFAEMTLAGQAAELPGGIGRVHELLEHWRPRGEEPDRRGWEWYYLRGLGQQSLLTLHRHPGWVTKVRWSPDGRRLVSVGADGPVRLWDAATGRVLTTLHGPRDGGYGLVAWSPDGRRLATVCSERGTIQLWDPDTGLQTTTLQSSPGMIALSWAPDGRRLLSLYTTNIVGSVRIWDVDTGRQTDGFRMHTGPRAGGWSPDGRQVAVVGEDPRILLWDGETKRQTLLPTGHTAGIAALSWSPDGRTLASAGADSSIGLWDVGQKRQITVLRGHTGSVRDLGWSPDGRRLASASTDQTVRVWDLEAQKETAILHGHTSGVDSVTWSPDGRQLASASRDQTVRVWNPEARSDRFLLRGHTSSVGPVSWAFDSRRLASGSVDGSIRVWDADTGQQIQRLSAQNRPVNALSWSPDGRRLAGGLHGSLRLWEVATGQGTTLYAQAGDFVRAVSWSPDGRRLASWDYYHHLRVWDTVSERELLAIHPTGTESMGALSWSPDGRCLASGDGETKVRLWDLDTKRELATLRGHTAPVLAVSWSPDGQRLASAGYDQTIKLWEARTQRELLTLRGHSHGVNAVGWSPDGLRLVSASADGTIKLWDTQTGQETLTLRGQGGEVGGVSWSPDGRRLASTGLDGTVRIWDLSPGWAAERSPRLLPELERRLGANGHSLPDLRLRSEIHARLGHWDQAAADWTEVARLQGDQAPRWFQAGWWAAGPFAPEAPFPQDPDADSDPVRPAPGAGAAASPWRAVVPSADGCLDLRPLNPGGEAGSAGVLLRVYSPREQAVAALIAGPGDLGCWLNGQPQPEAVPGRSPEADEEALPVTLRTGWNTLLFRVGLGTGKDRLAVWLSDESADRVRALADRGRWDEAQALVQEARVQQPNQAGPLLLAARFFRRRGDSLRRQSLSEPAAVQDREARRCYEQLRALQPDHAGHAAEFADFLLARLGSWEVLEPIDLVSAGGTTLTLQPDGSILASGKNPLPETYTITARAKLAGIRAFRLEVLPDASLPRNGPGRSIDDGNLVLSELRITAAPEGSPSRAEPIVLDSAWADHSQDEFSVGNAIDGKPDTGWAMGGEVGQAHVALFTTKEPLGNTADTLLTFALEQRHADAIKNYNIGRFRLSVARAPDAVLEAQLRASLTRGLVSSWTRLGAAHYLRGEWQAALAVLQKATAAPDGGNGWDQLLLTLTHEQLGQPYQPASAAAWLARSRGYLETAQPNKALADVTRAIELDPNDPAARQFRGQMYLDSKKWAEALADYTRAVELKPDDVELLDLRADLLGACGKWRETAADFARLTTLVPVGESRAWDAWYRWALASLAAGQQEEYRKACGTMLQRFRDTEDWGTAHFTAWTCALGPDAVADYAPVLRLAEKALAREPDSVRCHSVVGAVLYRMGRVDESLTHLLSAAAKDSTHLTSPAYACYFLALAQHRLGHPDEAQRWLARATAQTEKELNRDLANAGPERWNRKVTLQLLRAEAEAALRKAEPGAEEVQLFHSSGVSPGMARARRLSYGKGMAGRLLIP